jgi:hypothetical protein
MKKERKGRTGLRKGDTKDIIHSWGSTGFSYKK